MSTNSVTTATATAATATTSTSAESTTMVIPSGSAGTELLAKLASGTGNKDNIIVVVNKQGGGDMKVLSKPLTVLGSPVAGGGNVVKKVLKVQQRPGGGPQSFQIAGKRNIVIASRPGMNQLIACAPVAQQTAQGSTPVILTQKVAAGGVVTSPVVSTGGVSSAVISGLGAATKIVTAGVVNSAQVQAQPQKPQVTATTGPQQKIQDVRVDNWGNFCIQRLQSMFDKGDWCDLTLRFHSSQELKVHRVVVNICTEYFANLEKLYGLTDGTLILPKDVEFQTMQTIIRFFYTGKLEVKGSQFNDIYRTVKMMNITILIKLLEAHSRKPVPAAQIKKDPPGRSIVMQKAGDIKKGQKGPVLQLAAAGQSPSGSPVITLPVSTGAKTLQVASPGMKLPPGMKTKTVLARVQAQHGKPGSPAARAATAKKVPVWKGKREVPDTPTEPPPLEKWKIKEEEPARPTRFEWGDPDDLDPFLNPSLTNHTLMEKQKEKHVAPSPPPPAPPARKAEDIFDSVKSQQQQPQPSTSAGLKRPQPEPEVDQASCADSAPPAPKNLKLEAQEAAAHDTSSEDVEMPHVDQEEIITVPEPEIPAVVAEETSGESTTEPETIVRDEGEPEADAAPETPVPEPTPESVLPETPKAANKKPTSILKPALKSPDTKSPHKTVRFAPDVEKENRDKAVTLPAPSEATTTASTTPTTTATPGRIEIPPGASMTDHSKIISEVLRKFPDLVKDNKNIKLKIVHKTADGNAATSKEAKSKVSYIVLKSPGSSDATASTVLKKAQSTPPSKFWETDKTPKKPSPAENMTGPWLCEQCGEGENTALQFDTYYNFRRHLVDVHGERIDARICEYCGQKASKRNLLLFHMYTKHGIQPPKNCTFPHCDRCDYVALSESLLTKHKQNHEVNKEFRCTICSATFKTSAALQGHMSANLHRNKDTKVYECPYCRKPFVRNINLKAHIRSLHRDVARLEEMEDPRLPPDESLTNRYFVGIGGKRRPFPSILSTGRSTATSGVVEFLTADSLASHQTVSYVTADGQPIEILDPSHLTSLPITLVSSGDDGMAAAVASALESAGIEASSSSTATTSAEYITSEAHHGESTEPVYVMDGGGIQATGAVEIDMANVGLSLAPDGTMVYEGEEASQNYVVQDMQGNQYRRITGIDETGKPVVFLQMIEGEQVAPDVLEESGVVEATPTTSSQMFVSSAGILPVSSVGGDQVQVSQQMIFASASDGTILVPSDGGSHQVVMSEAVLAAHGEPMEVVSDDQSQHHLQLVQQSDEVIHDQMGQPVQTLQLVLDQQESRTEEEEVGQEEGGMQIVEVPQSETYNELELEGATYTQLGQAESTGEGETEQTEEVEEIEEHEQESLEEDPESQQVEIDENSQQLQIDEEDHDHSVLKLEALETQQIDISSEDTQVVTEENLEESIELVEGQTLTLIEEEDGTQTIKLGGTVEQVSS